MKLSKKFLKNSAVQSILACILYGYIRLVHLTCRWEIKGKEHYIDEIEKSEAIIMVFWHGRVGIMINTWKKKIKGKRYALNAMVSAHSDGELLTKVIRLFGFKIIRGSTGGRQAVKAYYNAVKALRNNESVGVTPDGPRGPRMRIKGSVVKIAQKSQAAMVPATISVKRAKILNTWDSFMLPLPFSRGVIIYKEAIKVPKDADEKTLKKIEKQLEDVLYTATKEADQYLGREVIKQAAR